MDFYNPESLQLIAEQNRWLAIWPELLLALFGVALLMLEVFLSPRQRSFIPQIAIIGQLSLFGAVIALLVSDQGETYKTFSGLLTHSHSGNILRLFFMLTALCVSCLARVYLRRKRLPEGEFYVLLIFITAGLMLLAQSSHFLMLFITLEAVTIAFYVLIGLQRRSAFSLEASFKYLMLGACSSALLLLGIVLLYGVAGNPQLPQSAGEPMDFSELGLFIAANANHPLVLSGALFVIIGILFKIGAAPFHIWAPDVYQGAPTVTTALLATASKAGGVIILFNLLQGPFNALQNFLIPLLSVVAAATILIGNITAAGQSNVKRLMGLSGVAHSGYLLAGIIASLTISWAFSAILFYLFTYVLASSLIFAVIVLLENEDDKFQNLTDYQNIARNHPFLGVTLAVGLGSLAGIPPLAGFIGKALIFYALFLSQHYILLSIAVIGVVISIAYYFGWLLNAFIRQLPSPEKPEATKTTDALPAPHLPWDLRSMMIALSVVIIVTGFFQGIFVFLF